MLEEFAITSSSIASHLYEDEFLFWLQIAYKNFKIN